MMVPTSSSYFLQDPKLARHFLTFLAMFLAEVDTRKIIFNYALLLWILLSQVLITLESLIKLELLQQAHAAVPSSCRHSPVLALKLLIALLHFASFVEFLSGRLDVLQLALISSSHILSTFVRFVIWRAPLLLLPLHFKLEALPPPLATSSLTLGPKTPFFPDFESDSWIEVEVD